MIWRGPVATAALSQLMTDVNWAPLDVLVVDMPPGTGDIQLTLAQRAPLSGAVIVSTPQDIALIDARKALAMFRRVAVPILGIVENMGVYHCPNCGHVDHIFGDGGAKATAADLKVPFLGQIPLRRVIRETGDAGVPVAADIASPEGQAFLEIARAVLQSLKAPDARPAPRLRILP
jgi:ATP-binding protein involved in chromosome partitioning